MTHDNTSNMLSSTKQSGMTLIEVIIGVAVFVLIGTAMILFERTVLWSTRAVQTNLTTQQQVRKTLQSFATELRAAKPSASGSYAIESASTSSIVFFSDIDATTDIERVRYFFATSSASSVYDVIRKGVTKPTGTTYVLANEVLSTVVQRVRNTTTTPIFSHFDTNYAGTSTALSLPVNIPSIRHVRMNIVVEKIIGRSTTTQAFQTQVSIRNLKDNH